MAKSISESLFLFMKVLSQLKSMQLVKSYGLIGGLAIGAMGVPRATEDVDILASVNDLKSFQNELKRLIEQEGNYEIVVRGPEIGVFPFHICACYEMSHQEKHRVCDILIPIYAWQDEIVNDAVSIQLFEHTLPVVCIEGLISLKLKSGGVLDLYDVRRLLNVVDAASLDMNKLSQWAKRAGVNKLLNKLLREQKKKHRKEQ